MISETSDEQSATSNSKRAVRNKRKATTLYLGLLGVYDHASAFDRSVSTQLYILRWLKFN